MQLGERQGEIGSDCEHEHLPGLKGTSLESDGIFHGMFWHDQSRAIICKLTIAETKVLGSLSKMPKLLWW